MTFSRTTPTGDRIIEPMIALACCSKQHRTVVAGSKGVELMLDLQRRGYVRTAATANCGHPTGQYDVALMDWRRRTFKSLEVALDWLVDFLSPSGVLVVWVDQQKAAANDALRLSLERRGFVIDGGNRPRLRLRRFGTAARTESGPQSRVAYSHHPADAQAAYPPVPSRKRGRHKPDIRRNRQKPHHGN